MLTGCPLDALFPPDTFDHAPEPPPGPALLDDSESNMLDNFFTTLNASQLNDDFWLSLRDQPGAESNLGFDWSDLPPTFEGSTTSLPPRPPYPNNKFHENGYAPNRAGPLSSDVLAAASMLYQNGTNGADYTSSFNNQVYTENGVLDANENGVDNKRHTPRYNPGVENPMHHKDSSSVHKGFHTNKMVFDPEAQNLLKEPNSGRVSALQWGSDASFAGLGYRLAPNQPSLEETTEGLLHNLQCLEPQSSAANTRPSSPNRRSHHNHHHHNHHRNPEIHAFGNPGPLQPQSTYNSNNQGGPDRPKKRRKSSNKVKGEDIDLAAAVERSTNGRNIKDKSIASPQRKQKGTPATSKQPRENLSEEQKRANHILSEQKRRNLIKQGFDELCALVPELNGGGYSKSTMLTQAADWLQDLIQGNEMLKVQLAELKARSGD